MLVITRRSADKIIFPQLGITVHFIRVQGSSAKVGVDAPREIVILRDELADEAEAATKPAVRWWRLPREVRHAIRNELHTVSVGLHLYRQQVLRRLFAEADETFAEVQSAIRRIDEHESLSRDDDLPTAGRRRTVLVVEDNANEREMLAGLLKLQGFDVISVGDGEEALEYLASHDTPAVILVDMQMPRCDGGSMVRRVRADQRHGAARMFAISGHAPEEYTLTVGDGGVDRWFRKPLNPGRLIEAI